MLSHRAHDGRPADPQVTGHRGDRVGVLADPPARLGAGPLGQHRPGADRRCPLGPGADPAGGLRTAPDPLAPGQHYRPATDGQVAHPDPAAAMELSPHPTTLTADHGCSGLDLELPLAGYDLRGQDFKAVQAEQPGGRGTTVLTHLGPPSCRRHASASASYARSQVLLRRLLRHPQLGTTPRFMTKSRIWFPGCHHQERCTVRSPPATAQRQVDGVASRPTPSGAGGVVRSLG
jgi:hypothetical protein